MAFQWNTGEGPTLMSYVPAAFYSTRRGCALSATGPDVEATVGQNVVALKDLSGNSRRLVQGTAANQPILVNSLGVTAWSSTSYLSKTSGGSEDNFDPGTRKFAAWGWIYPTNANAVGTEAVFGKWNSTGNKRSFIVFRANGTSISLSVSISLTGAATVTAVSNSNLTVNAWNFWVLEYDPATSVTNLWLNNILATATPAGGNLFSSTEQFSIGFATGQAAFAGKIGQVGYRLGSGITQDEVTQLYASGAGLPYARWDSGLKTNLISCWQHENGFGRDVHSTNHLTENGTGLTGGQGPFAILDRNYLFFDGINDSLVYDGSAAASFLTTPAASTFVRAIILKPGTNLRFASIKKHNLAGTTDNGCFVFQTADATTPQIIRNSVTGNFPGLPVNTVKVYGAVMSASALTLYSDTTSGSGTANANNLDVNSIMLGSGASGANLTPAAWMRCLISDVVIYPDAEATAQAENAILKLNGPEVQ